MLCGGDAMPMQLIRDRLEIGEILGEVPADTPSVPLQADLEAQQRRLRLKPAAEIKPLDLDLRNDTDLARSRLLHRLAILGIGWGKLGHVSGKRGTFHELWTLEWQPELAVALVEASLWGNTVEFAAGARLHDMADTCSRAGAAYRAARHGDPGGVARRRWSTCSAACATRPPSRPTYGG